MSQSSSRRVQAANGMIGSASTAQAPSAEAQLLIARYYRSVHVIVEKLMRIMSLPGALKDDFLAAGALGLVEAASRFDPSRGSDFRAFAFLRIRGAVIDHIRVSCELSGRAYRMYRALVAAHEMRERMVSARSERGGLRSGLAQTTEALEVLSQSAVAFALYGVAASGEATAPENPEVETHKNLRDNKIRELVATLPEKERMIIEQHYFHDRSFVEIANNYAGLSKSWISRLHDRALTILRARMVASVDRGVGFSP
jgi:RNA polymerase sigma factor for flagellar operon FliA